MWRLYIVPRVKVELLGMGPHLHLCVPSTIRELCMKKKSVHGLLFQSVLVLEELLG